MHRRTLMNDAEGVVVTGVFGVGKSSVIEEMAELLEQIGVSYGAIDVDWLWWFAAPGIDYAASRQVLFANLRSVVGNYLDAGVMRFLVAWAIQDQRDLDALRESLPFPLRVFRLTAPIEVIRKRLAAAVSVGRQHDLRNAERWLRNGTGSDLGEESVAMIGRSARWQMRFSICSVGASHRVESPRLVVAVNSGFAARSAETRQHKELRSVARGARRLTSG